MKRRLSPRDRSEGRVLLANFVKEPEARASLYRLLDEGFEGGFSEEQSAEDIFEEARR